VNAPRTPTSVVPTAGAADSDPVMFRRRLHAGDRPNVTPRHDPECRMSPSLAARGHSRGDRHANAGRHHMISVTVAASQSSDPRGTAGPLPSSVRPVAAFRSCKHGHRARRT
jgi:hypothetical protein